MAMFRRALLWGCALVLLAGAGITRAVEPLDAEKPPALTGESKEPVLLRYKLKKDQVLKFAMAMNTTLKMEQGVQSVKMVQDLKMDAKMVVTEVDANGDMTGLTKITRMQMTIKMGARTVTYDSDDADNAPREFKGVTAMVNVGIPAKFTPTGKFLETDIEPLRLAAKRAGDAGLAKSIEQGAKKMFEGTFVQLSEKPIAAGETYKAGVIADEKVKVSMDYKIAAVSADGAQAVLEPKAKLEIPADAFPGGKATITSQELAGWLKFDVKNGLPGDAAVKMHFVVDVEADGETGTVEATADTQVRVTIE